MWLGGVARDVGGGVAWIFFGIMGFTHPQATLVNSMRLAKKTFHAIWGLCWYDFISPIFLSFE